MGRGVLCPRSAPWKLNNEAKKHQQQRASLHGNVGTGKNFEKELGELFIGIGRI